MTDDGSDLVYNYGAIDGMVAQLQSFVNALDTRLSNDVDREFKNLLAHGWSGSAADSFQGASAQWHAKVAEMNAALTQLHGAVGSSGTDMSSTDSGLTGLFG